VPRGEVNLRGERIPLRRVVSFNLREERIPLRRVVYSSLREERILLRRVPSLYTTRVYTHPGTPPSLPPPGYTIPVHYWAGYAADLGPGAVRTAWAQGRETAWVGGKRSLCA